MCERSMLSIREQKPEHAQQLLADIKDVSSHLMEMSERIKKKSDTISLQNRWFPLSEILESVLSLVLLGTGGNVKIEKNFYVDCELYADELHVREVLNNLLQNSLDALNGKEGMLTISTYTVKKRLYIETKDNGIGIPPESTKKFFEPFFSTKKNALNYGLGLSYCYNVLRKHGGSLKLLDSKLDEGTAMAMIFPPHRFKLMQRNKE